MNISFTENEVTSIMNGIVEIVRLNISDSRSSRKLRFLDQHGDKIVEFLAKVLTEQDQDDQSAQEQPNFNINEAEQQWAEIRQRNVDTDIAVCHMPPQVNEVAKALGYTVSDMPDVIARLADGTFGEVSVEDLQMIEKKIGEKIYFRQAGNDDIDVADLDPSDYPLTQDSDEDEDDGNDDTREWSNDERYNYIDSNAPHAVLFPSIEVTKEDLMDYLHIYDVNAIPDDLTFDENGYITFGSFKHLDINLPTTNVLVRMPKGIFEVKNLNLAPIKDEDAAEEARLNALAQRCRDRIRRYNILFDSKTPTVEEFATRTQSKLQELPKSIEKNEDGTITFAWLVKFAKKVGDLVNIKVCIDDTYVSIEDVINTQENDEDGEDE